MDTGRRAAITNTDPDLFLDEIVEQLIRPLRLPATGINLNPTARLSHRFKAFDKVLTDDFDDCFGPCRHMPGSSQVWLNHGMVLRTDWTSPFDVIDKPTVIL